MKIQKSILLSITLIALTFGAGSCSVKERLDYPELLVTSKVAGLNLDNAFDLSKFDDVSRNFDVSEGTVTRHSSDFYFELPESFASNSILKFSSENAYLEVVGYGSKSKMCSIAVWFEQQSMWSYSFKDLTKNECAGLQVTRSSSETDKLLSYVSEEKGIFYYFRI